MYELTQQIQREIKKVIIGKDEIVSRVLMAILAEGHVLLEDVPGVGKTTLAMSFARVLGLDSRRVQFTSDTMPSDIIGFSVYDKQTGSLAYKSGAIMTNLLLADEINRTSNKTQSALLEAMEERRVTVDGVTHDLPRPFVVLATQNPAGTGGTVTLPSSQLDRFMVKLSMGYPDRESQIEILSDRHHENPLDKVSPVTDIGTLEQLIEQVRQVTVVRLIYSYVTDLVDKTRSHPYVLLGLSPRGALAVCRAAKAEAYLQGRDYVIPADVAGVFPSVACHRLVLSPKARLHECTAEQVVEEILASVPAPEVADFNAG